MACWLLNQCESCSLSLFGTLMFNHKTMTSCETFILTVFPLCWIWNKYINCILFWKCYFLKCCLHVGPRGWGPADPTQDTSKLPLCPSPSSHRINPPTAGLWIMNDGFWAGAIILIPCVWWGWALKMHESGQTLNIFMMMTVVVSRLHAFLAYWRVISHSECADQ